MSCLINCCIRNRSLNVLFVFVFVTWVVGITNLKCFILKFSVYQWEGNVSWISTVSTCVSQGVSYIRVVVGDVAWKWDVAFTSMDGTCEYFWTIRFLHNAQVNIWISWKATSDSRTVYCKSSIVVKVCFSPSWMICFKELPYTESETISVWIQSIARLVKGCIFDCCTVRICNNWNCRSISTCWDWWQLCSNCCNTVNYWVTSETVVCDLSQHIINSVTKTFTLFCIGSVCCWCSKQCCWFSDFFLNCCDSCLNFSFSSCVCQFCLVVFSNINEQFCFWNVLIQDCFFIFLSRCFWCSRYCWTCRFRMWSRVWSSCAFCVWLAIRSWVVLAKWYRFRDSLWQFCWYRLWQWYWSICTCLSVSWRACRLLACWCYCWSFWSYCFWYRRSAQSYRFRVCQNIMSCSCLAFQSWSTCFFGLSCVSSYCTTCHSTRCCNPFKEGLTWKKRSFFFYILNWNWRCVCATFNNFEKSKVWCSGTKPVFTRFNKFEASHTVCFAIFSFLASKKHIYLQIDMSHFLIWKLHFII